MVLSYLPSCFILTVCSILTLEKNEKHEMEDEMRLAEIYSKMKKTFPIRSVNGNIGMSRTVQWVHMVEDLEVAEYINGNELIFTTGIADYEESWLLKFVQRLHANHASGLVVNIGPYIKSIPDEVIEYGKKHEFALMEMPWEVHLVDVFKYISAFLLDQEKRKAGIVNAMKDALFYASDNGIYKTELERYGYDLNHKFCPVLLDVKSVPEEKREVFAGALENVLSFYFSRIIVFKFNQYIVVILYNGNKDQILECCKKINEYKKQTPSFSLQAVAAGPNLNGVEKLTRSYQIARDMIGLAEKLKQKEMIYDDIGIYQLLLTNPDKAALKGYAEHILKDLIDYDRENGTDYIKILRTYLETDCSVQETARREFCHRNTINHRIHQMKQILGKASIGIYDKVELLLAFAIMDLEKK